MIVTMSNASNELCPCCSGKLYKDCCQKYHAGLPAETALQLMRSRYSAYALNLPDYIIQTTHPKNSHYSSNLLNWKMEIESFTLNFSFKGLEILDSTTNATTATVTFTAQLSQNNHDASFTEKSTFKKVDDRWLYLSGEMLSP